MVSGHVSYFLPYNEEMANYRPLLAELLNPPCLWGEKDCAVTDKITVHGAAAAQ